MATKAYETINAIANGLGVRERKFTLLWDKRIERNQRASGPAYAKIPFQ